MLPPVNCVCQPGGIAVPGDLSTGAPSPELGRTSGLSFKPTFSLSSFTFLKRLFTSSSLSAIGVVSSVYLRFLIFLPAILILACASSSPVFLMMYSVYKLNKQGDNIQPDVLLFLFGTSLLFHVQF